MEELQYLTRKDLEYLYELEKKGETVVIRINEETLLSLDPEKIIDESKREKEIDEHEFQAWIEEHEGEMHSRYEENQAIMQENAGLKRLLHGGKSKKDMTLASRLLEVNLDADQRQVINDAITKDLDEQQILFLLQDNVTTEEMQRRCERILQTM